MGRAPHVHPSRSLTLEWNNLGAWEDAFATFCRALAGNSTLRQLDLRNNQVSHKGAEELALVLKSHPSLQQLDLRWNNIGLLGGRALANCLPSNRTLWRLELAGNSVPSDILRAVEQAMDHNQDREATLRENQARTRVLSKEVRHLREEKSKQFLDLMETIDKQREEMARSSRTTAARVGQLQEALNERHSVINALKAKLQMAEAAQALSEQKAQDLGELLATAKQEQQSLVQKQAKEHRLEQQEAAERESKLLRDLSAANEKNLLLRNQVQGCRAMPPGAQGRGGHGLGHSFPAVMPISGGRARAEGEVAAGPAVPDQAGADQHVSRAEDAGHPG